MSKHTHKFIAAPELRGSKCICGVSRFGTTFGAAEYNPKTKKTIRISDKKVLYAGAYHPPARVEITEIDNG